MTKLSVYKEELAAELNRILKFWSEKTIDNLDGGFYGRVDNDDKVIAKAPKGSVLNARILWSFSAAFNQGGRQFYLDIAGRAYHYITNHFIDSEYGGVYWSVNYTGQPLDTKKQVYAIAFTIYGLSEYYRASGLEAARQKAIDMFYLLVEKAYDPVHTGYFEAFAKDWQPIADQRLSAKDANETKTMNTHLHVLEAYTSLYLSWPDKALKEHIELLLNNFLDYFINRETWHLNLFFDEDWQSRSALISYGHEIEAAWLLLEAAEVIGNENMISTLKRVSLFMAEAAASGLDRDGGLWYEYEPVYGHLVKEKHWWVQAEAMVGFYNAWQTGGDDKYLELSLRNWEFVKGKVLDRPHGEWFWGIYANGQVMRSEDKVGIWKCPYHNSRACMEIIKRIDLSE